MAKNVQIPLETFLKLCRYFFLDEPSETLETAIKRDLEAKLDSLVRHELYSTYKTAPTEEEREAARQKYLESVGIHSDFRW